MKAETSLWTAALLLTAAATSAIAEPDASKLLTRSVYMPVTFRLCEHLEAGVVYQDDAAVGRTPTERIFQFTYYPVLERLLPEAVQIRVEGHYVDDGEPFVARLAVTANGLHTASKHRELDTQEQMSRQRHKIDARLEPREIRLVCPRFCSRSKTVARNDPEPPGSVEEP